MKIHLDDWKLVTFKDIGNIPKAIRLLESRCKYTRVHCNDLEEVSSSFKYLKRMNNTDKQLDKIISLYS